VGLSEAHMPKTYVFLFWICDRKTIESFADDYVTDYDVACFTVQAIEQWCNCHWLPHIRLSAAVLLYCVLTSAMHFGNYALIMRATDVG